MNIPLGLKANCLGRATTGPVNRSLNLGRAGPDYILKRTLIRPLSNCFHRRDAKGAEIFFLFFAVDPPKIPADRKDGKE